MSLKGEFAARVAKVLAHLNLAEAPFIGAGGEGRVYAVSDRQVVKIYGGANAAYLTQLAALQRVVADCHLPFQTPLIEEIGQFAGTFYTFERRLQGQPIETLFERIAPSEQMRLLEQYLFAVDAFQTITFPNGRYGQAIQLPEMLTASAWDEFLQTVLTHVWNRAASDIREAVPDADALLDNLIRHCAAIPADTPKCLVHGDYFPGNVLFEDTLHVAAVLDFSPHTVIGDPRMDIAGALSFLSLIPAVTATQRENLYVIAVERYGSGIVYWIALYTLYYSVYFADTKLTDPSTFAWCIRNLNDAALWDRLASGNPAKR